MMDIEPAIYCWETKKLPVSYNSLGVKQKSGMRLLDVGWYSHAKSFSSIMEIHDSSVRVDENTAIDTRNLICLRLIK